MLYNKIVDNMNNKKGAFTIVFHDNSKIAINVTDWKLDTNFNSYIVAYIITFTNDINQTTRYDIQDLKDAY